jgi:hypothetical protein
MPPKKKQVSITKEKAYEYAKKNINEQDIIGYIREHPNDLTDAPVKWGIIHQIVYNGNVPLLKEIVKITNIHIPLDLKVNINFSKF